MATQPTIKRGSSGPSVVLLQQRLTAKGFATKADGIFGPGTETVLEQFQASCGITADGICGPLTWSFLMSEGQAATPEEVQAEARAALVAQIPASAPADVRKVLEAAIGALGKKEVPNGSNGGAEIAEIVEGPGGDGLSPSAYYLYWGVKDKATLQSMPPWCCLFVCWALRTGLAKATWKEIPFGNWFGGCSQVEDWAKKNGKWTPAGTGPIPSGAAFTISREASGSDPAASAAAGHIGLIVCDQGDYVITIEGNVSNKVGSSKRKKTDLRGHVVWW